VRVLGTSAVKKRFAAFTQPEQLLAELLSRVRPLASTPSP
jgi:hypothetical protein